MKRSGRGGATERSAGLLGRAYQGIGIIRMTGLFADDALERLTNGLEKLHT